MSENPYQASQVEAEPIQEVPRDKVPRIGGWLLLPALGITLGPLLYVISLAREIKAGAIEQVMEASKQYPGFLAAWSVLMVMDLVMLGFQIYIALRFFKRHAAVPQLMVIMYLANLALAFISCLWFGYVFGEADDEDIRYIMSSVIGASIWIPYFLNSKRVKATFVVDPDQELREWNP